MTAISVRDLDDRVAARLKVQAARNGRSMEAEVRAILTDAVTAHGGEGPNLAQTIVRRFSMIGGVELPIPPRSELPRAAALA